MTKYRVLAAAGGDNTNANANNITFTIKDTKLYVPITTYQLKTIKTYQKFLAKSFVKVSKFFVLIYSDQDDNAQISKAGRYYQPKDVIKNHNFNVNGKNFMTNPLILI